MNNRILYSKNGTLEDFSVAVSKYGSASKSFDYETGKDRIYISSRLPFNHLYFKFATPSASEANASVKYYNGTKWVPVVEIIDETKGFNESGFIQFTPDRKEGWAMKSTNYAGESVEGLTGVVIYDMYWIEITFDVDMPGIAIEWIGNLFSNDEDLGTEYPDLVTPSTMTSFKLGKTNWQEQHARASSILIGDLVNKGIICGPEQILDWREFTNACLHKTAEIIFNAFGDDYVDQVVAARKEYNERLTRRFSRIDKNNDATESAAERYVETGYFTR